MYHFMYHSFVLSRMRDRFTHCDGGGGEFAVLTDMTWCVNELLCKYVS